MTLTMIKKCFPALLAATIISIAASFAVAQDNQSASPSQSQNSATAEQTSPSAQGDGGRHHGSPDPATHAQMLAKHLKLSSDQQAKAQAAFETERSQMESLRVDSTLSQQDRHTKMMDIRKSTDAQVRAILDSNQQKKWDEIQAKREQRGENYRHGSSPGGDQQTPPQQ